MMAGWLSAILYVLRFMVSARDSPNKSSALTVLKRMTSPVYFSLLSMTSIVRLHHCAFPFGDGTPFSVNSQAIEWKLEISGIYLADDFSFIGLDRQFSIFIMLIPIAAPAIETRGSILSALGHAPFDILTARFIVRLGDSTEDRDYQFTVFRRCINIRIP